MNTLLVVIFSFGYLLLLFGVAYWAEKRSNQNSNTLKPYVYALSMAVYCTAWTFYGSIGRAADFGPDFLAIYIGPTIAAPLWFLILRKMIRICKAQRITSIADFISARYGKNTSLGTLATIVCVLGVIPYISLQIKAIAITFAFLVNHPQHTNSSTNISLSSNIPFWITVLLAIFIIIFGTRKVDSTERHEGMVTAVAFESIVKLLAFLVGGIFVVFFLFNGFDDIFSRAAAIPALQKSFTFDAAYNYTDWMVMCILSMFAVLLLPRQFQVAVVENVDEKHLYKAIWLFPLYLLVINVFVLPIALAGQLIPTSSSFEADFSILSLPFVHHHQGITLLVYLGGFSAATGMIIVETIALSTMLSNNLLIPLILKVAPFKKIFIDKVERSIKNIRRLSIILILLLAYAYFAEIAESYSLVSTGLISFAAVAQFAPAVIGGMFWSRANKNGALLGVISGFTIWFFTLIIPAIIGAGLLPKEILSDGLFGVYLLKPNQLFGLDAFTPLTHAFFWSMFINILLYVLGSLYTKSSNQEEIQAELFINVSKYKTAFETSVNRTGQIKIKEIKSLMEQFLGQEKTKQLLTNFSKRYQLNLLQEDTNADQRLITYAEKILSGVIGSASSRILIESIVKEEEISLNEVVEILKESQQFISLNKELQQKSEQLKKASDALELANMQMKEAEIIKDDFLYSITHELRTPLTSIRAFSEILYDNPELDTLQRQQFLATMIKEIERLSRLITQVLDLEKLESGKQNIQHQEIAIKKLIEEVLHALSQLIKEKNINLSISFPEHLSSVYGDQDLLSRVVHNLVSNAIKYCDKSKGSIKVEVLEIDRFIQVNITDNGEGIPDKDKNYVFNKFYQTENQTKKAEGSGLGLAICKKIVELHQGEIGVIDAKTSGACFYFTLPIEIIS
ncbi:sensor histidine kinase [Pedobacter puniceum]|uniref:histidine kinase n=1 Tax=Pedobacter puniceum TaxID=2666136 RepID=A0A7K0FR92_9SPHI|nr:sensor histidine kinase [Pedobacter puniceum]MRX48273.1 GHKL domain-containing protein [Pedobacter puniceum]